jgi:taurine dioxygenase
MVNHTPLCTAFGAEIHGIDLARITEPQFRLVYGTWKRHHVVLFRGQQLSPAGFESFAARFGELDAAAPRSGDDTEWHASGAHLEQPPFARIVHAVEPPARSAIWFANLAAALRSMPPELVARLRRLAIRHTGNLQAEEPGVVRQVANEDPLQVLGTVHPLVIVQPESGEHTLYLGRRRSSWFAGLPLDESERLLNIVWSYATAPAVSWHHTWRHGDLLLWNNLTTLHRHEARDTARQLRRAQLKGRYTLSAPIQQEAA